MPEKVVIQMFKDCFIMAVVVAGKPMSVYQFPHSVLILSTDDSISLDQVVAESTTQDSITVSGLIIPTADPVKPG